MTTGAKPLTKAQIVAELAEQLGMTKKEGTAVLECLTDLACRETKRSGSFTLPGLGKLVLQERAARTGRNPATGAEIQIPAKTVVKFRIAKACKEAIIPQS